MPPTTKAARTAISGESISLKIFINGQPLEHLRWGTEINGRIDEIRRVKYT
jgi:hypothetical protein